MLTLYECSLIIFIILVAKPSKGGDAKLKGLKITKRKPDDQCQPVTVYEFSDIVGASAYHNVAFCYS